MEIAPNSKIKKEVKDLLLEYQLSVEEFIFFHENVIAEYELDEDVISKKDLRKFKTLKEKIKENEIKLIQKI